MCAVVSPHKICFIYICRNIYENRSGTKQKKMISTALDRHFSGGIRFTAALQTLLTEGLLGYKKNYKYGELDLGTKRSTPFF